MLALEPGRQEAKGQEVDRKRGKEKTETLLSVLSVIVEVHTDTRKPPPPPDSLPDEKEHTLLRTGDPCVALPGLELTNLCSFKFCYSL